jgi:hypothetical protein
LLLLFLETLSLSTPIFRDAHKSLKQNVSLCKSPTKTVDSQSNHFFAALWGYVKLEVLKFTSKLNHFAIKSKLYVKALQHSFTEWLPMKPFQSSA